MSASALETSLAGANLLVVGLTVAGKPGPDIAELASLARAAGAEVSGCLPVSLRVVEAHAYMGSGKVAELKERIAADGVDGIFLGCRLTPSQQRNLERDLAVAVFDHPVLILEIFAQRARSFEGKLQVELARLNYLSSRLVRGWTHLERQSGGIGLRSGPGESQLEVDRRVLATRIRRIRKRLGGVERNRELSRSSRSEMPTVALVGYTNSGKSTLFNALTEARVYTSSRVFATLDTVVRRVKLDSCNLLLIDTVGFISALPLELIDAFRATLREASEADLLLHVVDFSDPEWRERMEVTEKVLADLGAERLPCIQVLNKIDKFNEPRAQGDELQAQGDEPQMQEGHSPADLRRVKISAQTGAGLDRLRSMLQGAFADERLSGRLSLPPVQGWLRARLYELKAVRAERVRDDGYSVLTIDIERRQWAFLRGQLNLKERESIGIDSLEEGQEGRGKPRGEPLSSESGQSLDQGLTAVSSRTG